jgi:hypothetical protein
MTDGRLKPWFSPKLVGGIVVLEPGIVHYPPHIKRAVKIVQATLPEAEQIACFLRHDARVAALLFPILSGDR